MPTQAKPDLVGRRLTHRGHALGWVPDLPDHRDFKFSFHCMGAAPPPTKFSVLDGMDKTPAVFDQGQMGSCTANAIAAALEFDMYKSKDPGAFTPSRLFIYYNERAMEGTLGSDQGAQIRDGIKSVGTVGYCPETLWPYSEDTLFNKPTDAAFAEAAKHKALTYYSVDQELAQLKGCIAAGYPFVFGFSVYENLYGPDGQPLADIPMPAGNLEGGHAVLAVGYDDATQRFTFQNSWGTGVGRGGFFTLPYAYLLDANLASDFWTVRRVDA